MSTGWDSPGLDDPLIHHWDSIEKGTKVSIVLDAGFHTPGMMIGVLVPEMQQVRILGAVNQQIRDCLF